MTDGQQAELYDYNSYGFEEVTNNAPGGQTLANNVSIEGNPAYGFEQITAAAGPLSEDASKLLNILNVTVTDLKKISTISRRSSGRWLIRLRGTRTTYKTSS